MKIAMLGLLLLAGCAGQSLPPGTPAPADIQAIDAQMGALNVAPLDYYLYGTTLAARNCVGWFGGQIAQSSRNSALSGELGLLGTAAGVAGGPFGAGAAAAMGFGAATLANVQANSAAGVDPVASYVLTSKVLQASRATGLSQIAAAGPAFTKPEAYMLVEDFAEKCQLPDIRLAQFMASVTAPVRAVPMSGAAAFGLVPETSRPIMPPAIVIGEQQPAAQPVWYSGSQMNWIPAPASRRRAPKPLQSPAAAAWPANVDRIIPAQVAMKGTSP